MLQAFPFLRVLLGWLEGESGTGTGTGGQNPPEEETQEADKGGYMDPNG